MLWIKSRNAVGRNVTVWSEAPNSFVRDSVLYTDGNESMKAASVGQTSADVNPWSSTGFGVINRTTTATENLNAAGVNYVSWAFRKAPKFFDVVTYTGDGTTSQVIPHSLGIMPGMIIIKATSSTSNWFVWHRGDGTTDRTAFSLNLTAASVNNGVATFITSSNFRNIAVQDSAASYPNVSGTTYVAYLYAHDTAADGIIQCGSYTGNGSTTGPVVNLGWEPQYLMVKGATVDSHWSILDSMRGLSLSNDAYLFAGATNVEGTTVNLVNPTATGFNIVSNVGNFNASGQTYIYMAIRRSNKPPTSGTQVFAPNVRTTAGTYNVGFPPDLLISKQKNNMSVGFSHPVFQDRLRGYPTNNGTEPTSASVYTSSASTAVEGNSFVTGGYNTIGVYQNVINTTIYYTTGSETWIDYALKRAPGFFDVVCYTGTGSAVNHNHNLSVEPEFIIWKQRNSSSLAWYAYHKTFNNGKLIEFSSSAVPTTSSNTIVTSKIFNYSDGYLDQSGGTYVAYLFATLAGISKVGSYTGNGSSQNIDCGFAAGARFVLIKRTDSTGDWYVWDTARGIVTGNDPHLSLNTTAAEVTTDDSIDPYSPGFTVNQLAATNINVTSATYIFLAIA
jgi:hypothetical protein